MKNSIPKHEYYYVDSEDEEKNARKKDEDSDSGSDNDSAHSSHNPAWPQSYRESIDLYSSVPSPSLNFLGSPSLSHLNNALSRRHTPEILPDVCKPLLIPAENEKPKERRSSHSLLPRLYSRKASSKFLLPDGKDCRGPAIPRNCSYGQAVLNGINVLCGVGILSTPDAVKEGGWIGLSILLIFGILCFYTGILLRRCIDSHPGIETYPDIGQAAFGTAGRIFVSVVLYMELYGMCIEYLIMDGDNLASLFPNAHLNLGLLDLKSRQLFAVLAAMIVFPTILIKDLKNLSYISALGVFASLIVVGCLFWVGAVDQVGFGVPTTTLNFSGLPVAIGLYGYCYSGHSVFPNIYSSLKNRNDFPAVLLASFGICTVLYASVATFGYLMFGESIASQFTLNLPQSFVASKIAVWTTVVNPLTKYALTMSPVAMSLEELIPRQSKSYTYSLYSVLIRTALVISTLVIGLTIPFFALVMALIGSLFTTIVALVLPCACYLSILRGKISIFQRVMCAVVILVGVVVAVSGTVVSISKIIHNLS